MSDTKTIRVAKDTHERLWQHKESPEDSFDDALRRVLERVDR